jgi:hypothetical protein
MIVPGMFYGNRLFVAIKKFENGNSYPYAVETR